VHYRERNGSRRNRADVTIEFFNRVPARSKWFDNKSYVTRHGVQRARRIFREELFWFDDA
jgi:hypothetical protein